MRYAFLCHPHVGGTYTVYRHLRHGLGTLGVDLRWVAAGPAAKKLDPFGPFRADFGHGWRSDADMADEAKAAAVAVEHLNTGGYDGVFVNVLTSRIEMNLPRYVRGDLKRILIVHNVTPGTYAPAGALRDWVHAAVVPAQRIYDDMIGRYGYRPERTFLVPHALDLTPYASLRRVERTGPLRIISLGRIEENAKGVSSLPKIMRRLDDLAATLTIAGDGPDLDSLKRQCRGLESRITFIGRVDPANVPGVFAEHDVFLMPSRYEGFGYTLIEAMAIGCVPVASGTRGVTDFVVEHGRTGFVFPVADAEAAARHIRRLNDDRTLWERMSGNAVEAVRQRFTIDQMAAGYRRAIDTIADDPPIAPLPMSQWAYPAAFSPGWRRYVPGSLKNYLRRFIAR